MSENVIAILLSVGLLGGMFLWVPLLETICPPCSRFLRSRRRSRSPERGADRETVDAAEAA